jgi:hypothetical protein
MKNFEAQVQTRVIATYKAVGASICSLSQGYRPGGKRHGTTRQTKGLADLFVFLPRRRLAFWHEVKAPDSVSQLLLPAAERAAIYRRKQTPEQALFELRCGECRIHYVLGGVDEALNFLRTLGIIPASYMRSA